MSVEDRYNKIYSENEDAYGRGEPDPLVQKICTIRPGGTVFELAAGQGRNALFLAKNGYQVRARDLSAVGAETIKKRAQDAQVPLSVEQGDMRDLPAEDYDIFVCTYALHELPIAEAQTLIRNMQEHTSPGGLNAIVVFTSDGDFYRDDPTTDKFYPAPGELRQLYNGWEIIEYTEEEGASRKKDSAGNPFKNVVARILAKRPSL
jgi:tellurite methyltransferase